MMYLSITSHLTRPELIYALKIMGREDPEKLLQLILDVDMHMADFQFTETLYARLGDALRQELEADA